MSRFIDKKEAQQKQKKAYDYLVSNGLKPHLAAAVVGNLIQESYTHLDSTIENKVGAVGIAQWLGPRKEELKQFAKDKGTSYKDFDTQLEFLHQELTTTGNSWGKKGQEEFFNSKTAEEAAAVFVKKFERSGESPGDKGYDNRIRNAKSVFLQNNDTTLYGKDDKGQIVNLDPKTATPEQIAVAPKIKAEFYEKNFDILNSKAPERAPGPSEAAQQAEKAIEDKKSLKDERDAFITQLGKKETITDQEAKKALDMQPDTIGDQQDPYGLDISVPGNEFFNFFLDNQ